MKEKYPVLLLPLFISVIGTALLFLVSIIPSNLLLSNLEKSAAELAAKTDTVFNFDRIGYSVDYHTDSLILMESYTLSSDDPASVFSNPMLYYGDGNGVTALGGLCAGEAPNSEYSRYWMGFRVLIRPLLLFTSYDTICWLISLLFFVLSFTMIGLLYFKFGFHYCLCFSLSLSLVNPAVVSHSPQLSCCFLLSFIFCIFVLSSVEKSSCRYLFYFCLYGAITQFFDFYTSPILTLSLPLLCVIAASNPSNIRLKTILQYILSWLYGYVSIRLIKLAATSVFVDHSAFMVGIRSFFGRTGITKVDGLEQYYDPIKGLKMVWSTVFPGILSKVSFLCFLLVVILCLIANCVWHHSSSRKALAYLFISLIPLIWYAAASQPTVIHYWFQYRGICVTICAILLSFAETQKEVLHKAFFSLVRRTS